MTARPCQQRLTCVFRILHMRRVKLFQTKYFLNYLKALNRKLKIVQNYIVRTKLTAIHCSKSYSSTVPALFTISDTCPYSFTTLLKLSIKHTLLHIKIKLSLSLVRSMKVVCGYHDMSSSLEYCHGFVSSPDPKGHVSYCYHWASVVRLSSVCR